MDSIWIKIAYAIPMVIILFLIWPRANQMLKQSPKGTTQQWLSVIKPLLLVTAFIVVLVMLVR